MSKLKVTKVTIRNPATGKSASIDVPDDAPINGGPKAKDPDLGEALDFPTDFHPHLCVAKRKKDQAPQAEHGVSFRRVGADAHVYATNMLLGVRLVLTGQGEFVPPAGAVVPAKAMRLVAQAEDEIARLWFGKGKVRIRVDGEQHEFRLIDVLPFPGDESEQFSGIEAAAHRVNDCRVNAAQLARVQKALGVEFVELVQKGRGAVLVVPEGRVGDRAGALALEGEEREPKA
jgi:hypothetical protein